MSLHLGCIADDYTGASDLANTLRRNGLRTLQTIGVPDERLALSDADAIVVSLKSRSIEPSRAVAMSLDAESWLRARGAPHILFKICSTFDSTDAGNIGPVMDALRQRAGCGAILVNPAFPETGRSVFQGHLFVNGVLLSDSPLRDHPLNPMRDPDLVRVLQRQSAAPVTLIPFAVVEQGATAVRSALRAAGTGAAIADAVAARHLDVLGAAALFDPLSVGASGLGAGLARALASRRGPIRLGEDPELPPAGGHAVILAGSCSTATRNQIETAVASGTPCLQLDVQRLLRDGPVAVVSEAINWAGPLLQNGPILIASSEPPDRVVATQSSHGGTQSGHAVEQALADIAEALVALGVRRLVVAGGETSGAIVDRLALQAFLVGDEIAPGVPVLRAEGSHHPGLAMALKSGNFGQPDFFQRALSMMR